jgi:hypothetical protein
MSVQDLEQRFPIVGADGRPTDYFMRLIRDRGSAQDDLATDLDTKADIAGDTFTGNIQAPFIRATGYSPYPTGAGVEIGYDAGVGYIFGYDRSAGSYKPLVMQGSTATYEAKTGAITLRAITRLDVIISGTTAFSVTTGGATVADEAYGAGWNGSLEVPTKNALYDKIESMGGGGGSLWWFDPPTAASFTLASSDATNLTLTDDADVGMQIYSGAASAAGRFAYVTLTDKTLAWDYVVRLDIFQTTTNFSRAGLAVRDSISGRMMFVGPTNNVNLAVIKDSALGTFSSTAASLGVTVGIPINWLRVQHTGGNIVFYASPDGKQWVTLFSEAATTFLTNRANQIGFLMHANTQTGRMTCGHYALTGPGV